MKNPEKQLFEALKIIKEHSYLALDNQNNLIRKSSNPLLFSQAEKMSLEAQEEIGRRNKTKMFKEMRNAGIITGSFEERRAQYKKLKYAQWAEKDTQTKLKII